MCKCGLGFSLLDPGQSLVGMCVSFYKKIYSYCFFTGVVGKQERS
jgi:hypothetical protein